MDPGQYKEKFPKKSPYAGGSPGVQVAFRNDSNEALRVNLDRIRLTVQLGEENRQEVQSAEREQLADAVMKPAVKDPTKRAEASYSYRAAAKGDGRDKHWAEFRSQAQDAQVPSSVVGATVRCKACSIRPARLNSTSCNPRTFTCRITSCKAAEPITYFDIDLSRRGPQ